MYKMGFFPSKTEKDIWMCKANGLYKYIGVYVDDLIIVMSARIPKGSLISYGIDTISNLRVLALSHFILVATSSGTMKGHFAQHHRSTLK